jgi:uroporphyrinogen III methyltransferase/synthase
MSKAKSGKCFLVGAGPGDLGLVTLWAKECIERADVIVYDCLSNPEILKWAPESAEIIYAGKKAGAQTLTQDEINALLVAQAGEGKQVVRLKGGDPFLFGRGAEEAQALAAARIPFVLVPGVTSAIAGPAYAGIPVTHPGKNAHVTFFAGNEDPEKSGSSIDFPALAKLGGTQVMLMGVERIETISREMLASGMRDDLPVALVRWATTGRQETLVGNLESIARLVAERGFEAPAVAIFGDVVDLRRELAWFEAGPLWGKRIVVTCARAQSGTLAGQLRDLGADVIELPTIRIEKPTDLREFAEMVQDAYVYDWIVFTSPDSVTAFFDLFYKLYGDTREIGGVRIAAIGPATAHRIRDFHLKVDFQADEAIAESVVREFRKQEGLENLRILLARSEQAQDVLPKELSALGAIVDEGFAYRTVPETRDNWGARERLLEEGADLITFTSSSAVENFMALGLPWPAGMKVASIGPVTSKTALEHCLEVAVEARQHDILGLVSAVRKHFGRRGDK